MSLAANLRHALQRPRTVDLLISDDVPAKGHPVAAAVLVAITDRTEPGLILTVRGAGYRVRGD